jgi:hypothetical protein
MVGMGSARRRSPRKRTGPKIRGICTVCNRRTTDALVIKGKWYIDGDGERRQAADALYHRECRSMQNRGLLAAGADKPAKDSSGSRCAGCNSVIEPGEPHAHRQGKPYHRECLY